MKLIASALTFATLSLCLIPKAECASPAPESFALHAQQDPRFGIWQREVADSTGRTKIILELRSDGTYTKSLDAFLKGHSFQASEEGTWTANGPLVRLSGDGSAPPSGHDLRNYRKVTSGAQGMSSGAEDSSWATGTWVGGNGDTGAIYTVTLTLNANGTYHKTLSTDIGVGGSHSGNWTLKGTTVYLSGDGKWPPYSHDLSKFKKVD